VKDVFEAIVEDGVTLSAEASCRAQCGVGGRCVEQMQFIGAAKEWFCICFSEYYGRTCVDRKLRFDSVTPGASPLAGNIAIALLGIRVDEALFFLDDERLPLFAAAPVGSIVVQSFHTAPLFASLAPRQRRLASLQSRIAPHAVARARDDGSTRTVALAASGAQVFFVAPPSEISGPRNVTIILPLIPRPGQPNNNAGWKATLATTETITPADVRMDRYNCETLSTCYPARLAEQLTSHYFSSGRVFSYLPSSDPNCLKPGFFLFGNDGGNNGTALCDACPVGAFCPGGGTALPLAGYWSESAFSVPQECAFANRCPGLVAISDIDQSLKLDLDAIEGFLSLDLATQRCEEGYAGSTCSLCADNFYLDLNICRTCGLDEDNKRYLQIVIFFAAALFFSMSFMVATFRSTRMSSVVGNVIVLQQIVTVLRQASSELSDTGVIDAIKFASVINFEISTVKPGCSIPALSLLILFWMTFLVMLVTSIFFYGASWLRGILQRRRATRGQRRGAVGAASKRKSADDRSSEFGGFAAASAMVVKATGGKSMGLGAATAARQQARQHTLLDDDAYDESRRKRTPAEWNEALRVAKSLAYGLQPRLSQFTNASSGVPLPPPPPPPPPPSPPPVDEDADVVGLNDAVFADQQAAKFELDENAFYSAFSHFFDEAASPSNEQPPLRFAMNDVVRVRFTHAMLILLSFLYLKMATRILQVMYCVEIAGVYVMNAERTTVCFEGFHLVTFVCACLLLIVYVVGFPVYCISLLREAFASGRSDVFLQSYLVTENARAAVEKRKLTSGVAEGLLSSVSVTPVHGNDAIMHFAMPHNGRVHRLSPCVLSMAGTLATQTMFGHLVQTVDTTNMKQRMSVIGSPRHSIHLPAKSNRKQKHRAGSKATSRRGSVEDAHSVSHIPRRNNNDDDDSDAVTKPPPPLPPPPPPPLPPSLPPPSHRLAPSSRKTASRKTASMKDAPPRPPVDCRLLLVRATRQSRRVLATLLGCELGAAALRHVLDTGYDDGGNGDDDDDDGDKAEAAFDAIIAGLRDFLENDENDDAADTREAFAMTGAEFAVKHRSEMRVQSQVALLLHGMMSIDRFGFLYRNVKTRYFFYRAATFFAISIVIALTAALDTSTGVRVFLPACLFLFQSGFILLRFPFIALWRNVLQLFTLFVAVLNCDVILGLLVYGDAAPSEDDRKLFIALTCMLAACALALAALYLYYHTDYVHELGLRFRALRRRLRSKKVVAPTRTAFVLDDNDADDEDEIDEEAAFVAEVERAQRTHLLAKFRESLRNEVKTEPSEAAASSSAAAAAAAAAADGSVPAKAATSSTHSSSTAHAGVSYRPKTAVLDDAWRKMDITQASRQGVSVAEAVAEDATAAHVCASSKLYIKLSNRNTRELSAAVAVVDEKTSALIERVEAPMQFATRALSVRRQRQAAEAARAAAKAETKKQLRQETAERRALLTAVDAMLHTKDAAPGDTIADGAVTAAPRRQTPRFESGVSNSRTSSLESESTDDSYSFSSISSDADDRYDGLDWLSPDDNNSDTSLAGNFTTAVTGAGADGNRRRPVADARVGVNAGDIANLLAAFDYKSDIAPASAALNDYLDSGDSSDGSAADVPLAAGNLVFTGEVFDVYDELDI
jgi:hypothetical protein